MSKNQKEQKTVAATKIEIVKRKDYKDKKNQKKNKTIY